MNEANNTGVDNSEINIEEDVKKETAKKREMPFFTLLFIGIVVVFLITLILYKLPEEEKENIETEQTVVVPTQEPEAETKFDELNKYTSLRLKNYDNIEPGQISEGQATSDEENPYYLIPGIVSFHTKTESPDEFIYMYVLDKRNIQNEEQGRFFAEAYEDIKNKNPERISKTGKPWALYTTVAGTPLEDLLTEIKNVSYPNTDYVYSLLFLEHGHEIAVADEESTNYIIRVFAIKGDIIMEIESYGNLIRDIGLSQEDHLKCAEMTGPNEGTDWLTYNVGCLSDIFASGKYDDQLTTKANEMTSAFEIQ